MKNRDVVSVALAAVAVLVVLVPGAWAAEGVHIKGKGATSLPWRLTDGAGYAWDIYTNGRIQDGTNDAYDGGMGLQVDGSEFVWSQTAKLHQNGREIELGPWDRGSLKVWRRIYVDPKLGYCRWIDLFENTSAGERTVNVRYQSNMGESTQMIATTTGQPNLTPKDWGVVTGGTSSSSRPAIAHVFATAVCKFKPTFTWNTGSDDLAYHVSLKIPAKRMVALCLIEAQRRPFAEAKKFLQAFKPETELKKIPPVLRRMIVNMGGSLLTLGQLELPRNEDHDLIVGKNENELLGTLQNRRYVVETFFGSAYKRIPINGQPYVQLRRAEDTGCVWTGEVTLGAGTGKADVKGYPTVFRARIAGGAIGETNASAFVSFR